MKGRSLSPKNGFSFGFGSSPVKDRLDCSAAKRMPEELGSRARLDMDRALRILQTTPPHYHTLYTQKHGISHLHFVLLCSL